MDDVGPEGGALQHWLARWQAGDPPGLEKLLDHAHERLVLLARRMLRDFPGVQRWEQTEDVLQQALVRLLRCLEEVRPATVRDFLGLAALQIRRELIDLARHYQGPQGQAAHHASGPLHEPSANTHDPAHLIEWSELHRQVDGLPKAERETFVLLYYQGLSQNETASLLGVSTRTVQRHWQAALLRLHALLNGHLPGDGVRTHG